MTIDELQSELADLKAIKEKIDEAFKSGVSQGSISIAGRSLTYRSLDELVRLRKYILDEIYRVEQAIKLAQGESVSLGKIRVRFSK